MSQQVKVDFREIHYKGGSYQVIDQILEKERIKLESASPPKNSFGMLRIVHGTNGQETPIVV